MLRFFHTFRKFFWVNCGLCWKEKNESSSGFCFFYRNSQKEHSNSFFLYFFRTGISDLSFFGKREKYVLNRTDNIFLWKTDCSLKYCSIFKYWLTSNPPLTCDYFSIHRNYNVLFCIVYVRLCDLRVGHVWTSLVWSCTCMVAIHVKSVYSFTELGWLMKWLLSIYPSYKMNKSHLIPVEYHSLCNTK